MICSSADWKNAAGRKNESPRSGERLQSPVMDLQSRPGFFLWADDGSGYLLLVLG